MGHQEVVFIESEGEAWLHRNEEKKRTSPVLDALREVFFWPKRVLEIGCSFGHNIGGIQAAYDCEAYGIDPSVEALHHGGVSYPRVSFHQGAAARLPFIEPLDLLIYGFCLYVCDREDIHKIVAEGDHVLENGGYIAIHDFDPEYPHKVPYKHVPGLFSYKMDYSKLWLANPAYSLVSKTVIGDGTAVWVLKKDIDAGWPLGEAT